VLRTLSVKTINNNIHKKTAIFVCIIKEDLLLRLIFKLIKKVCFFFYNHWICDILVQEITLNKYHEKNIVVVLRDNFNHIIIKRVYKIFLSSYLYCKAIILVILSSWFSCMIKKDII